MKRLALDIQSGQVFVRDFDACRITIAVLDGGDGQSLLGRRMRNQFNHGLKRRERFAPPIERNVGKESVLDLIPFAGCWRHMADGNGQPGLCGELLQLYLPQPVASPVGSASISNDEQLFSGWIEFLSDVLPPAPDTFYSKFGGLMVETHIDEALVVNQVINALGDGFPICDGTVIIHIDTACPALWLAILARYF